MDHGTAFDIAGKGIADPTSLMDVKEGKVSFKRFPPTIEII